MYVYTLRSLIFCKGFFKIIGLGFHSSFNIMNFVIRQICQIIFRFYKASKAGTQVGKDQDAKRKLKKYFSHVLNGVGTFLESI